MGRERPAAVYGFSALATPAAALAGHLLRAPSIGALFGTFLHPALGRWRRLAQHVEEVVAFKTPVDRLVILDDGTRGDDVARWFHVPQQRLRFWMHGVDIDRCVTASRDGSIRADLCLSEDTPLVVSPSRLASWKRVDDVLRAFAGVVPDHPRATLVVSGSGPEEAALKALATEILPPANVRFVGALSRDINLRLIAQADVFCSFYDFSNIGYALLEALAAGVAVVVTDTGATTARVTHDMNGLVVPPRDVTAATAAIARLLGDAGLRSRLAANARIHADRTFLTLEDRARLEVELLREIGAV
jgi:glycosyltransferase involved in cell wall biosynthesis